MLNLSYSAPVFTTQLAAQVPVPSDGVLVARVRAVNTEGLASPWFHGHEVLSAPLPAVTDVVSFSDAQGSRVSWQHTAGDRRWLAGYAVSYGLNGDPRDELAGATRGNSINLPLFGKRGDDVSFRVTAVANDLALMPAYASRSTQWREQTNQVPDLEIQFARFRSSAKEVYVAWDQLSGPGIINIIGYQVQYQRDSDSTWRDSGDFGMGGRHTFDVPNASASNPVRTVRVRAVAWPGKHASDWKYAGVYQQ